MRYVGPSGAQRAVVGIRLDERKRGLGDGKRSSGERHFRCEPGHAIFASPSQCRLVARAPLGGTGRAAGKENEAAPAPAAAAAPPPAPPFDLEAELEAVVGLAGAKDALRSLREPARRRQEARGARRRRRAAAPLPAGGGAGGRLRRRGPGAGRPARRPGRRRRVKGGAGGGHEVEVRRPRRPRPRGGRGPGGRRRPRRGGGRRPPGWGRGRVPLRRRRPGRRRWTPLCEGWRSERTVLAVAVDEPRRAALLRAAPGWRRRRGPWRWSWPTTPRRSWPSSCGATRGRGASPWTRPGTGRTGSCGAWRRAARAPARARGRDPGAGVRGRRAPEADGPRVRERHGVVRERAAAPARRLRGRRRAGRRGRRRARRRSTASWASRA